MEAAGLLRCGWPHRRNGPLTGPSSCPLWRQRLRGSDRVIRSDQVRPGRTGPSPHGAGGRRPGCRTSPGRCARSVKFRYSRPLSYGRERLRHRLDRARARPVARASTTIPTPKVRKSASKVESAPWCGCGRWSVAAEVPDLGRDQRRAGTRARRRRRTCRSPRRPARPSIWPAPVYGTGFGGSMCSSAMPAGGTIAKVSIAGPSSRSGPHQRRRRTPRRRCTTASTIDELPAAERLGDLRDRRELQDPPDRGHLVGHGRPSTRATRAAPRTSAPTGRRARRRRPRRSGRAGPRAR